MSMPSALFLSYNEFVRALEKKLKESHEWNEITDAQLKEEYCNFCNSGKTFEAWLKDRMD
ncbi:MAG: hypothetical protein NWF09_07740 [Candidatus Bathyarchaeota archaeon]|nr:hypothetical protein [Candidatus Bathyarchaeota archaeon]